MRTHLLCLLVLVLSLHLSAPAQVHQEWVARYDGPGRTTDDARAMVLDGAGNVYVTGRSVGISTAYDYATVKLSSSGVRRWEARYSGPGFCDDYANDLAVDDEGNVYVTGLTSHAAWPWPTADYCTIKYNSEGRQQWVNIYDGPARDGDWANAMALDDSGNVYVTGASSFGPSLRIDFFTIKYNPDGSQQWTARYAGLGDPDDYDEATALAVDSDHNVYVTGSSDSAFYYRQCATVKYNCAGSQQWVARYQPPALGWPAVPCAIALDRNGSVFVSTQCGTGISFDYATIKYNSAGVQQWVALYDGPAHHNDYPYALAVDDEGNAYATGVSISSDSLCYSATVKYDPNGVQQWAALYAGSVYGSGGLDLTLDDRNNVYVTGYTIIFMGGEYSLSDFTTVKYDSHGNQRWIMDYDGPASSNDMPATVKVDRSGNVYVAGESVGIGNGYDYTVIKYSQHPSIAVSLIPTSVPITIPAIGATFNYYATVTNNETAAQICDAWIMVQLPNQSWHGPVLGPLTFTLPATTSLSRLRQQSVPASAPAGMYGYEARVGDYPSVVWNTGEFTFTKLGTGNQDSGFGDWTCTGEPFPGESNTAQYVHPSSFLLYPCTPNPFNATTVISFELRVGSHVTLSVYDTAGRLVMTLADGWQDAGSHQVNCDGSHLCAGLYLYRLAAEETSATGKMVLLK